MQPSFQSFTSAESPARNVTTFSLLFRELDCVPSEPDHDLPQISISFNLFCHKNAQDFPVMTELEKFVNVIDVPVSQDVLSQFFPASLSQNGAPRRQFSAENEETVSSVFGRREEFTQNSSQAFVKSDERPATKCKAEKEIPQRASPNLKRERVPLIPTVGAGVLRSLQIDSRILNSLEEFLEGRTIKSISNKKSPKQRRMLSNFGDFLSSGARKKFVRGRLLRLYIAFIREMSRENEKILPVDGLTSKKIVQSKQFKDVLRSQSFRGYCIRRQSRFLAQRFRWALIRLEERKEFDFPLLVSEIKNANNFFH